ncbi:hypothetical protein BVC80_1289g75 [Macleaya cordata]|uniref:Coiled-coil domain-containing protein R3HCC1L n=1 Tax=Macleaya cordata TaxID=56857 RepID=A0A200Q9N7_MACCD|nr:hypothetical protein BVC80_1289g75 [Macleaya cordata]
MEGVEENWSVAVEDLLDKGDTDGAISLLESLISKLETLKSSSSDLQLSTALSDLANLYSSRGFSLKADQLQTRAFLIKQNAHQILPSLGDSENAKEKDLASEASVSAASACDGSAASDDDWEAIADRAPNEILTPQHNETGISGISLKDTDLETPKRRGRGAFLYKKNSLYSDQQPNAATSDNSDDEAGHYNSEENSKVGNSTYGTGHVLVLADFPPSTRTTELEKLFENFRDRGVVIRWVNDTVALAVFRTPSVALEARNSVRCPFIVRALDENDSLLSSISRRDLEPPYPRPKTSVRTAQRLIAQGMGRKLSTETFGSSELRKQEEARKTRIVTRQILKDEAWGDD